MSTPSPPPNDPHEGVAAILLGISQTPPQRSANEARNSETPRNLEHRPGTWSSSPASVSFQIHKVSNSDDEDAVTQARAVSQGTGNGSSQPTTSDQQHETQQFCGTPYTKHHTLAGPTRPTVAVTTPPPAYFAPRSAAIKTPDGAPLCKYAYNVTEPEYGKPPPAVRERSGSGSFKGVHRPVQIGLRPVPPNQWPSMMGSDMLSGYLGPDPSVAHNWAAAPSRFAFVPTHVTNQASHESVRKSPTFDETVREPERMSQPSPGYGLMPPALITTMRKTHHTRHSLLPATILDPPFPQLQESMLGVENVPAPDLSEVQRGVKIPCAPFKHIATPPGPSSPKRPKTVSETEWIKIEDFKYRTIKAINMPVRSDLAPHQDPSKPTEDNLPYGDDVDYKTSWVIYWLDEEELTYSETSRLYQLKFPGESGNDDTIRKKHVVTLVRLANKYGLKPEDELAPPGKHVLRRGQQAGHKYNTIGGKVVYGDPSTFHEDARVRPKRMAEPLASRGFLKACICVWKDTQDMSFDEIQQRLENKYGWKLRTNTVQNLYYKERPRVYDMYEDTLDAAGKELD